MLHLEIRKKMCPSHPKIQTNLVNTKFIKEKHIPNLKSDETDRQTDKSKSLINALNAKRQGNINIISRKKVLSQLIMDTN